MARLESGVLATAPAAVPPRGTHRRVRCSARRRPARLGRHRTIEIHRHFGNRAGVLELFQPVQHLFDAADRERRYDDLAAAAEGIGDDPAGAWPLSLGSRRRSLYVDSTSNRSASSVIGSGFRGALVDSWGPRSPPNTIVFPATCMMTAAAPSRWPIARNDTSIPGAIGIAHRTRQVAAIPAPGMRRLR